ncbi:SAM-dependent methyltransferase [Burkholderia territorii]|uniref:class I SAM-dependent methyltransferase n=1 Tax=Burkholderia territorii TaxID=1503055 RepID=UPI0008413D1B|nr:class I SAM-dependent methyltransferase [Burkholderia territorii]AOI67445.1 SAM-dependent methyltransferase [Burkholderia territorii]
MIEHLTNHPATIACKVCGADADICGVVDFSRCGADMIAGKKVDPFVGVPIYYYACRQCGFTCTRAFDHWTHDDFARHVYNDDYARHDPEYLEHRPQQHADLICTSFPSMRENRILDFGSGLGLLEKKLSARGFTDVTSYDPFSHPVAPLGQFDAILSFEVFEHHPDPRSLFADIIRYRAPAGALLFQTSLITPEILARGIEQWWYCVPRNGHISFYTSQALTLLATQHGLEFGSFSPELHVAFDRAAAPGWFSKFFR